MALGGDHTGAGIFGACSELYPLSHYSSTQSTPSTTIVVPAGADIAGDNIFSIDGGTGALKVWLDTVFPCQQFYSSAHSSSLRAPMILVVSDSAQTMCAHHTGVDASCFPSSGIQSSGNRDAPPHNTLGEKELLGHTPNDKGMLDTLALYPPCDVAHDSLETQNESLGESRDYSQPPFPPLEPIKWHEKVPISRSNTPPKQPIRGRTGRYSCGVCGDRFTQPQGARRHHREKHEPRQCPYCHAFRWGRLYLFKKHLKTKHPEIDPKIATSDATQRNQRRSAISTGDQTFPRVPPPESERRFYGTKCPTTLFPLAQSKSSPASDPPLPSLNSLAEMPDTEGDGAKDGTLRPLQGMKTSLPPSRQRPRSCHGL